MYKCIFLVFVSLLFFIVSCQKTDPVSVQTTAENPDLEESRLFHKHHAGAITVLTRNVYVGTSTSGILSATNLADIIEQATEAYDLLNATNFPERAFSLAREIKMTKPDLIGLQEISLIRLQTPTDFSSNPFPNAQTVVYDYLDILMQALASYDLKYKVAGIVKNFDVEVPLEVDLDGYDQPIYGDIRLTDYDVVLARTEVGIENVVAQNYQVNLPLKDLGTEVFRGYVAVDAKVGCKKVRFVNTHLEAFTGEPELDAIIAEIQYAQAMELVSSLANEETPIILVGDFNSPAPYGDTYQYVLSEGFHDAWTTNLLTWNEDGYTFGHDGDLRNEFVDFYERIDFVFTKNPGENLASRTCVIVVGDEYRNRTPSGLWPSDHGGVVAKLKIPRSKGIFAHSY
jgi:endonuclease/exonuclease/phosphatase family metal-dependent hydrolase